MLCCSNLKEPAGTEAEALPSGADPMTEDIAKAVSLFRTLPELEDYAVYERLVDENVERQRARAWWSFCLSSTAG